MLWISGRPDGHSQGEMIARDGVTIPYRQWSLPGPQGVILYYHGQGDHTGPFTAMGDLLHARGFALFAHDHRGFGLSRERRGHIDNYDTYVDDGLEMIRLAKERYPGQAVFLLGLSMGGHLALRTAYRAGSDLDGVIALSPGFKLRESPSWLTVLRAGLYALLAPDTYVENGRSSVTTTRNHTHIERSAQDEYYVTQCTARFYSEAVRSIRKAKWELLQLDTPVLILQAGEDHLICPEENRRVCDRIGHPDKEFRLLDGLCHNLVVEPEMPEVARQVAEWIEARLPTAPHGGEDAMPEPAGASYLAVD